MTKDDGEQYRACVDRSLDPERIDQNRIERRVDRERQPEHRRNPEQPTHVELGCRLVTGMPGQQQGQSTGNEKQLDAAGAEANQAPHAPWYALKQERRMSRDDADDGDTTQRINVCKTGEWRSTGSRLGHWQCNNPRPRRRKCITSPACLVKVRVNQPPVSHLTTAHPDTPRSRSERPEQAIAKAKPRQARSERRRRPDPHCENLSLRH